MKIETIVINAERNVTLTCNIQGTGEGFGHLKQRPAILIMPGGGYNHCSQREADPVAFGYLKNGFQAFILRYTCMGSEGWPLPLEDYSAAMKIIHERANEWNINTNQVVTIGFSAGGHLTCAGALLTEYKPTAMILGYSLLTDEIEKYASGLPSLVEKVDANTPPTFLFATANDASVSVQNTIAFASALAQYQVPFECHIYPYGKHGYSTGEDCAQSNIDPLYPEVKTWVEESILFIRDVFHGDQKPAGYED